MVLASTWTQPPELMVVATAITLSVLVDELEQLQPNQSQLVMRGVGLGLVLGRPSVTAAARGDLGVLARLDIRGLDGGIAARVDGDVTAGRERGLHMGGG